MNTNDGGPAFPRAAFDYCDPDTGTDWAIKEQRGMTLRDYFAAAVIGHLVVMPERQDATTEQDANYAYKVADAMLKARGA